NLIRPYAGRGRKTGLYSYKNVDEYRLLNYSLSSGRDSTASGDRRMYRENSSRSWESKGRCSISGSTGMFNLSCSITTSSATASMFLVRAGFHRTRAEGSNSTGEPSREPAGPRAGQGASPRTGFLSTTFRPGTPPHPGRGGELHGRIQQRTRQGEGLLMRLPHDQLPLRDLTIG